MVSGFTGIRENIGGKADLLFDIWGAYEVISNMKDGWNKLETAPQGFRFNDSGYREREGRR